MADELLKAEIGYMRTDITEIKQSVKELLQQAKQTNGRVSSHDVRLAILENSNKNFQNQIIDMSAEVKSAKIENIRTKDKFNSIGWKLFMSTGAVSGMGALIFQMFK